MRDALISMYRPGFIKSLVYMLQATEYNVKEYLAWFWRVEDFKKVSYRKQLDRTKKARLLLLTLRLLLALVALAAVCLLIFGWRQKNEPLFILGGAVLAGAPVVTAHLGIIPLLLGKLLIQKPREHALVSEASEILGKHPATKIAIAGSYGKTTLKEVLTTVLSEGKKVGATTGNINQPIGHARFARGLKGNEQVLIIELGEYRPGDILRYCKIVHPNIGVITGVNEAHLSKFKSVERAAATIFGLADYLDDKNVFVNAESEAAKQHVKPSHTLYSRGGVLDWKVSNPRTSLDGTTFTLGNGKVELKLKSKLIGLHNVSALALAVAIADQLGLSKEQIETGIANTKPFSHRLQPQVLPGHVVLIDDTYNGNIDGIRAGLEFFKTVTAKRKVYVTPGLVEQGGHNEVVHKEIGRLAAEAADIVVLMRNSATRFIQQGLSEAGFKGEVLLMERPKEFYENIEHFTRAGDVVLMQNDWPDNYV